MQKNKRSPEKAYAASLLSTQVQSAFSGTSAEELRLKSIFEANANAFAGKTQNVKRKASNEAAEEAKKVAKASVEEFALAVKTGNAIIEKKRLALSVATANAEAKVAKSRNAKQAARRNLKQMQEYSYSFDRRTIFVGLGEPIAKQMDYAKPTKRDWEIGQILTKGLKNCESQQEILAKLKEVAMESTFSW